MSGNSSIEALVRNVTLSGVVAVAILLCAMIVCLLAMVLSLTFDCWWTIGDFCNIGAESPQQECLILDQEEIDESDTSPTHRLHALKTKKDNRTRRPPWLLRLKNGKLHNVKAHAYNLDLEMV
uniref:Uncharacterized protein n=1 Tax=Ditylenchus dipsaci TaxID=166011 RepID=A0A915E4T6_9BILA